MEEVGVEKVAGIVTDNAANMKSGWQLVQKKHPNVHCIGCVSHALHLLCNDFFKKIDEFQDSCKKAEKVVKYFGSHHLVKHELEEQQRRRYGKLISLKKHTPTRWGTLYAMYNSLLCSKDALLATAGICNHFFKFRTVRINFTFYD